MADFYTSVASVRRILDGLPGTEAVFIVTGKKSFTDCGAEKKIKRALAGRKYFRFSDFSVNPKAEDVKKGISFFREQKAGAVIAVGGGSVLDMAKMINLFAAQKGAPEDYIVKGVKPEKKGLPLIAVPTTSGSGSEATHFAVVYVEGKKYSLASPFILPDYTVLDYGLTKDAPLYVRAAAGMDALAQGVESYWNIYSTPLSKRYAAKAVSLALANLSGAVLRREPQCLKALQLAAHYGGRAINITKTTAPHALSYYFTTHFGLAHGHAVGLTLGPFFEINAAAAKDNLNDPRGAAYVRGAMRKLCGLFGESGPAQASEKIRNLMAEIGLETDFGKLGIGPAQVEELIQSVNIERLVNNPVKVRNEYIREIFLGTKGGAE